MSESEFNDALSIFFVGYVSWCTQHVCNGMQQLKKDYQNHVVHIMTCGTGFALDIIRSTCEYHA